MFADHNPDQKGTTPGPPSVGSPRQDLGRSIDLALECFRLEGGPKRVGRESQIQKYIFNGEKPEETPLLERPRSTYDLLRSCQKMIVRAYFRERHWHFPGDRAVTWALGAVALLNPKSYRNFLRDLDGQKQFALQEEANETALEYGLTRPLERMKAGDLDAALRSFRVALDAAPDRRADTYRTIGNFCSMLYRFQRDLKSGTDIMRFQLSDHSDSRTLRSRLIRNEVEIQRMPEYRSSRPFSIRQEGMHNVHLPSAQPVNWERLRRALEESTIPFKEIGREAYLRAARLLYDKHVSTKGKPGPIYEEPLLELAQASWLQGEYEQALRLIDKVAERKNFAADHHELWKLKADVLRDNGNFQEATDVVGRALHDNLITRYDRFNFEKLIQLCRLKHGPEAQAAVWKEALPYFQRHVSKLEELNVARGYYSHLYLGLAELHTGNQRKAQEDFQKALRELPRSSKAVERRLKREIKECMSTARQS